MKEKTRLIAALIIVYLFNTILIIHGLNADGISRAPRTSRTGDRHDAPTDSMLILEGTVVFAGIPMSSFTSTNPAFWVRDESTGASYEDAVVAYDSTNGYYQISNLPSNEIGISIIFHVTGALSTLPGNYRSFTYVDPSILTAYEREHFDIGVNKIIHLTEPWDNNALDACTSIPYHRYETPLTFSWDPIPYATTYSFYIDRFRDRNHPGGQGFIEILYSVHIDSPTHTIELEDSNPNEYYGLRINARDTSGVVGDYMTTYSCKYGWNFQFRIDNRSCEKHVVSPNGGEIWVPEDYVDITWTSEGAGEYISIEYSIDDGNQWSFIAENTEDIGMYGWTVPAIPSPYCLVRVCDLLNPNCCDESDANFIISTDCDYAVSYISVPSLVSFGYTTSIQVAITNLGITDVTIGDAYIDILDDGGVSIFDGEPVLMERILKDPFFLFPAGETLYAYQYDWLPTQVDVFYTQIFITFYCDTNATNDTLTLGPVTVSEYGTGVLGYYDQHSSQRDTVYSTVEGGPAVRYTIPDDLRGANVHTLYVGAAFEDPGTSFWVYIFGPGENDTTLGHELIEPFEFFPQESDSAGLIVIDLTEQPDYENLTGLSGDLWVHLKATDLEALHFTARPALPDAGVARNWYYVWNTPRRGGDNSERVCQPPGDLEPTNRGWEGQIGIDYDTCLLERGDVTRDGKVNVLDVLAVINHVLNVVVIDDENTKCRADCNDDYFINVLDALGIANVILGIGECEP